jgi:adenylosuccinate lyase
MALVKAGADRQEMHERLRDQAMIAWQAVRQGEPNPLAALLAADPLITRFLPAQEVEALMQINAYVGIAPERARTMAARINKALRAV